MKSSEPCSAVSPGSWRVEQEQVETVFAILEDWFQALEEGTACHRLPDPAFVPPQGRPALNEKLVEQFIRELDREMAEDAFGSQGHKYGVNATCDFCRLEYPQQVALVQQIMGVVLSKEEIAKRATT